MIWDLFCLYMKMKSVADPPLLLSNQKKKKAGSFSALLSQWQISVILPTILPHDQILDLPLEVLHMEIHLFEA
jgi:hypothetical protein